MSAASPRRLSPLASRVLALLMLLLLIAAALAALAIPAWKLHEHYNFNIASMTRRYQAQTAANAARPQLVKAVEALQAKDNKRFLLKGSTPVLATAELQDVANTAIEASGGKVLMKQPLPHKDEANHRQVATTVQVSANSQNLRKLLHALESKEPYLFVDALTVRSNSAPGYKPPPGAPEPEMFVQMEISAFAPLAVSDTPARPAGAKT